VPESRFHGWVVASAAACVLLVRLGGPPLWDDDEPKNAACSLAMLDADDWVVPTFNGRLRIEKPPLVNWLQMAGFALCGRNEAGARITSAVLTIGSCLLTWRTGSLLLGPLAGLWGGLAMATCVWTAVGGRAATPDGPLLFFTTLTLYLFVSGSGGRADGGRRPQRPPHPHSEGITLDRWSAACIGAASGAATLAKGPVGLVLPTLAFLLFAIWSTRPRTADDWRRTITRLRPLTIGLAAAAVAGPWYAWVALRTDGAWLHGFLVVHNVGRFVAPMEGHSGSLLYYPAVLAIGLFPWSIVLAATVAHAACILRSPAGDDRHRPLRLLACWAVAWVGCFSCAGTKLPGYIWPAYPAFAIATGLFLADWADGRLTFAWPRWPARAYPAPTWLHPFPPGAAPPRRVAGTVMRIAWSILALAGVGLAIGLPTAAGRLAPGAEWLGCLGLIPLLTAALAWQGQSAGLPQRSLTALAVGACLLVSLMASVAAEAFSAAQGSRALVRQLAGRGGDCQWACLWNVPPSLVFYTNARIETLATAADVAAHLRRHPRARVVVDGRQETLVTAALPPGCGVLARAPTLDRHDVLLLGRLPGCDTPLAVND